MVIFSIEEYRPFDFSYLVNTTSIINDTVGILPNIINTLYIVIVTLLIACPIGIGGAIYLNEYTKNKNSLVSFHLQRKF